MYIEQDPLEEARNLLDEGRTDEARLLADFTLDTALSESEAAEARLMQQQLSTDRPIAAHAKSFLNGALSGEPKDLAGFLGALSLDLFIIGDIRDLLVQGYRELSHGNGDTLILSLAAVGLATTLTRPEQNVHGQPFGTVAPRSSNGGLRTCESRGDGSRTRCARARPRADVESHEACR